MTHQTHGPALSLLTGGVVFAAFGLLIVASVIFEVISASRSSREPGPATRSLASVAWLTLMTGYALMGSAYIASSLYHPGIDANSNSLALSVLNLVIVGLVFIWAAPGLGSRCVPLLMAADPPQQQ